MERVVRPRWRTPFEATKRVLGLVILLLGATLLAPLPFSHIIPAVVVMLLAFAFLEEDGVLLCIALAAAVISLDYHRGRLGHDRREPSALDELRGGQVRRDRPAATSVVRATR